MAGKFLERDAIIDSVKTEHRMNAIRKRMGLAHHPFRVFSCGCPDPACGAAYVIDKSRRIPTCEECKALLTRDNRIRKPKKRR